MVITRAKATKLLKATNHRVIRPPKATSPVVIAPKVPNKELKAINHAATRAISPRATSLAVTVPRELKVTVRAATKATNPKETSLAVINPVATSPAVKRDLNLHVKA